MFHKLIIALPEMAVFFCELSSEMMTVGNNINPGKPYLVEVIDAEKLISSKRKNNFRRVYFEFSKFDQASFGRQLSAYIA